MSSGFLFCTSCALTLVVAPLVGQVKVAIQAPVAGARPAEQPQGTDEVGVTVELPENPNLSLYLKKAKNFLATENYTGAIRLLQDVIDGRTDVEIEGGSGATEKTDPPKASNPKEEAKGKAEDKPVATVTAKAPVVVKPGAAAPVPAPGPTPPPDPSQCVFSADGRLFRPVRRLCHELLATMPTAGLEAYRILHEHAAEQLLQKALLDGDVQALELVGNRYFITLAAGQAMLASSDLLMHQGRYRAAVQVLRDLLEIYPPDNRRQLGVQDVWLQFKIALAMRLSGELGAAHDAAAELARQFPEATLRIMGELQAVKDLPDSPLFAGIGGDVDQGSGRRTSGPAWLTRVDALVPLWQFRYTEPQPYKSSPNRGQQEQHFDPFGGGTRNVAPPATKHGTGTSVAFLGEGGPRPSVLFLDHFCLRRGEPFTGLITHASSGLAEMPAPRDNQARSRVPSYDWGMLRPVEDEARYFTVTGYTGRATSVAEVLKNTDLIAWNKHDLTQVWSSRDWLEGENGLKDVIFLAAPAVFGERLIVPVKRRDYYGLQCVDRQTGRPMWCTRLHAGGSQFFRAPGIPARVQGGIAYVLTNAGGLAAVDAFSGNLKWIRRYERRDPRHPPKVAPRPSSRDRMGMVQQNQFIEEDLPSYLPSDLVLAEGCVIFAPSDGDILMCLDGASGEPVWMVDGAATRYTSHKQLQYLLGANSRFLFAVSEDALVCIGLRSGLRLWNVPLPAGDKWRGRGCVTEDFVLIPGSREVLVLPTGGGTWRRVTLPGFGVGKEPLSGACNLFWSGAWLGVCYAGGIEVYSAVPALTALAESASDPLAKAGFLAQAGEVKQAVQVLEGHLATLAATDAQQTRAAARMLELARDLVRQLAGEGKASEARAWLDRVRPFAQDRTVRLNWHLARMDLFQQSNDLRAYEDEQQSLYRFLEGKDQ